MNTQPSPYIQVLDTLRGCAALSVFLTHFSQQFLELPDMGFWGRALESVGVFAVSLFFVLSGFLIHSGMIAERKRRGLINWKSYARRRFFRIYPAYVITLLACSVFGFYYHSQLIDEATISTFLEHLSVQSCFVPGHIESINGVLWTVVVECHFYAMYPLLCWASRWLSFSQLTVLLFGVNLIMVTLTYFFVPAGDLRFMIQRVPIALFWQWCLGIVVAEAYFHDRFPRLRSVLARQWMLFPLLLSFLLGIYWNIPSLITNFMRFVLPVISMLILGVLVFSDWNTFRSRLGEWLGQISFSIYLWHPIAIAIAFQYFSSQPVVGMILSLFVTLVFATLSFYIIEIPSSLLGRKKIGKANWFVITRN